MSALFVFIPPQTLLAEGCQRPVVDEWATIAYVHDGDTVRLRDGRSVRLIGINTPELARKHSAEQPLAQEAKDFLNQALASKRVGLVFGPDRKDRHGRVLAHLMSPQGMNLNLELVRRGLAHAIAVPPNVNYLECYTRAEYRARKGRSGLWKLKFYQPRLASQLSGKERGFHLVRGRVVRIDESRKAYWLHLDGPIVVRITKRDIERFANLQIWSLIERGVEVRGWIHPYKQALQLSIRHHFAMKPLEDLWLEQR
ncbi:MAG: thermonuclease family protein [Gammaproteobacteria bacterium]|nr:thermonuclease family protein [Gammaproteobacteria bacterium]